MLELEIRTLLGALALDVRLGVGAGECLALTGASGAGKTTVLRVAAGLLLPQRGRVACDGEVWLDTEAGVDLPPDRRGLGYLFQEYALFPNLSEWRNVAYGMDRVRRGERRERAVGLLDRFGMWLLHKAVRETAQLNRESAHQGSCARRRRAGRPVPDGWDGGIRNPCLEGIQWPRRGFLQQPRHEAVVSAVEPQAPAPRRERQPDRG